MLAKHRIEIGEWTQKNKENIQLYSHHTIFFSKISMNKNGFEWHFSGIKTHLYLQHCFYRNRNV